MKIMIRISIMILIFTAVSVTAQVPADVDTQVVAKVQQEHQSTRQFIATEVKKQNNEFITELTKRADFYEEQYQDIMKWAVVKLSILWTGVMFFFVSFNNFLRYRLEKKKYRVFKESMKKDILEDFKNKDVVFPKETDKKFVNEQKPAKIPETKDIFAHKNKPVNTVKESIIQDIRKVGQYYGRQEL